MIDQELCFTPATELRQKIDAKEVSIVELTELFHERIQKFNPKLNAYLALCPEQAMAEAKLAPEKTQKTDSWRGLD